MNRSAAGTSSGNITHTNSGASEVDLAVSGTAANCISSSLAVAADTFMNSGNTKGSYNYGGSTTIQLNPYYQSGGSDQYRAPL